MLLCDASSIIQTIIVVTSYLQTSHLYWIDLKGLNDVIAHHYALNALLIEGWMYYNTTVNIKPNRLSEETVN